MAPRLYSGTKIWSYLPHGYSKSNASSKNSRPWRVTSKISSWSKCSASDARQNAPRSTCCSPFVQLLVTRWYGPAATEVMYDEIGFVGANSSVWADPSSVVLTALWLLSTCQPEGAVTTKVYSAFMSGCSKQAMTRRESAGSYCV